MLREGIFIANVDLRPSRRPTCCSADQSIDAKRVFGCDEGHNETRFFRLDREEGAATVQQRQQRRLHGLQGACDDLCRIHRQAQRPRCHWQPAGDLVRLDGLSREAVRSLIVRGQVQRPVSILSFALQSWAGISVVVKYFRTVLMMRSRALMGARWPMEYGRWRWQVLQQYLELGLYILRTYCKYRRIREAFPFCP